MSSSGAVRIVIIGGGILGTSTAAHLARQGAQVTLVTEGRLADGASGRSIAWLNSAGDRSPAYHYLRLLGIDRYRTWSARHPESQEYLRFDGAMTWAAEGQSFRDTFAFERAAGYDAVWVARTDIASVAPAVDPNAVAAEGAIFNPGEGWVHLPGLIAALAEQARRDGARILEGAGNARAVIAGGAVTGVELSSGETLDADRVVLATGASVPAQLDELGVTVPDASPAAFVLVTDPVDIEVKAVLNTPRVAVRPAPDGRLVLDADWAEQSIVVGDDGSLTIPPESVTGLLDEASRVLAGSPRLTAESIGAGSKPIPGDGNPVTGSVPSVDGLYVLFSHSGATLGLILGELLAEEILTGRPSPVLQEFRIERFAAGASAQQDVATGAWSPVSRI